MTRGTVVLLGLCFKVALLVSAFGAETQRLTDAFRAETLRSIGSEKARLLEFEARRKTAIVLMGQSVRPTATTNGSIDVIITGPPGSHLSAAMAAAIDRRGYFITAAHVAADEPLSVVFCDGKRVQALPAYVVAKLENSKHEGETKLDVAVLHVDAEPGEVFEWADQSKLRGSDLLCEVGRVIEARSETNGVLGLAAFAGNFKKTIRLQRGGSAFRTDMPARHGDSGGPVLTLDGKLLGVECGSIKHFFRRSYEVVNRPDLKWLEQTIALDQQPRREVIAADRAADSGEPITITVTLLR